MAAQVQRKLEFPVKKPTRSRKSTTAVDDSKPQKSSRSARRSTRNKNKEDGENVLTNVETSYRSPKKRHSSGKYCF